MRIKWFICQVLKRHNIDMTGKTRFMLNEKNEITQIGPSTVSCRVCNIELHSIQDYWQDGYGKRFEILHPINEDQGYIWDGANRFIFKIPIPDKLIEFLKSCHAVKIY